MAEDGTDEQDVNLLFYKKSKSSFLGKKPHIIIGRKSYSEAKEILHIPSFNSRQRKNEACLHCLHSEDNDCILGPLDVASSSCSKETGSWGRQSSLLNGIFRRSFSASPSPDPSQASCEEESDPVKLISYRRSHSSPDFSEQEILLHASTRLNMERSFRESKSSNFVSLPNESSIQELNPRENGSEKISSMLEDKFMNIPPPAGFDTPTRPSTLLAALVRGPVSLDEASLSPATQRRLAYFHRHSQSSSLQISRHGKSDGGLHKCSKSAPPKTQGDDERSKPCPSLKEDIWAELPTSPLSPPSPFQHPFFRRQLGLLPNEPWTRFSGFGLPRLSPLFQMVPRKEHQSTSSVSEEEDRKRHTNGSVKKMTFQSSTTRSLIGYCKDTKFYKACKEAHFFSDGVSETESEDEEDVFVSPLSHTNIPLTNNNHLVDASGSADLPHETLHQNTDEHQNNRLSFIRSHSPSSSKVDGSNRSSQAPPSEGEIDDISSLTTSEPDSFHDAPSPHSPLHSPEGSQHFPPLNSMLDKTLVIAESDLSIATSQESSKVDKLYKIVNELLFTERSYVKVLHLIDQEFQFRVDQENRAHNLFPNEQMPLIFSNVKSIFKLHNDFLLPQLEERVANWDSSSRIGDIMKNFAPFLKMYTDYVRNFDNAMSLISLYQSKCPRFANIMDEIHQLDACGNLTLQHHMLSPVQRIPRYEMLLRDYLKKLPEDSPDREDTEKALYLVSTAASHANDAMKKIDKFQKLLEVQESLGGSIDLVSPTRELIKEGRIIKISYRSGDHQERYLFLFTDLLLLCTPRLMGGRVISGPQYRLRAKYNVENLQVLEGDNLETANTFYIRDSNKSVELYTNTRIEKESWLEAIFLAIFETHRRKSSLKLSSPHDSQRVPDPNLGLKQPMLIKMDSVSKCMQCGSQFSVVRRKHHCRACGFIFCNKCSSHKANLAYDSGKSGRVCQECHESLSEMASGSAVGSSPEAKRKDGNQQHRKSDYDDNLFNNLSFRTRGVLEISAKASGATMLGFLQLKTHRKAWVKRWFVLHRDFVLYSFKTEEDEQALTATPLPGLIITHLQVSKGDGSLSEKDREKAFRLHHAKKQYLFLSSSRDDALRWISALQQASRAELPATPLQ